MKKKTTRYRFNPTTLTMDKVETSIRDVWKKITWPIVAGFVLGWVFFGLYIWLVPSPQELQYKARYEATLTEYEIMDKELEQMQIVLKDLMQRDENLYRALLQADPIPLSSRLPATQELAYYDSLAHRSNSRLVADVARKMDMMETMLYSQAKSYEEILDLAKQSKVKMENLPAIQPVLNKDLTRLASGYGWRVDPVYHTRRFHKGMDFTAPQGTDIYATGNGRVVFAGWKQGYGNCIEISHGFEYATLYAHLHKIMVREGQRVTRGDVIGLVGNSGKSTGPHLHYEVHYKGQAVDPRNFYFLDLNPEEYDKMIQLSNNAGKMMD